MMEDWAVLLVILAGAAAVIVGVLLWRRRAQAVDVNAWEARVRALWMDAGHATLASLDVAPHNTPERENTLLSAMVADDGASFLLYRRHESKAVWAQVQVPLPSAQEGLTPAREALFFDAIAAALKALMPRTAPADLDTFLAGYRDGLTGSCHAMLLPGAAHNQRRFRTDRIEMVVSAQASPPIVACRLTCRF